jgi:hypothetical protein
MGMKILKIAKALHGDFSTGFGFVIATPSIKYRFITFQA